MRSYAVYGYPAIGPSCLLAVTTDEQTAVEWVWWLTASQAVGEMMRMPLGIQAFNHPAWCDDIDSTPDFALLQ